MKDGFESGDVAQILLSSCGAFGGDKIGQGYEGHPQTIQIGDLSGGIGWGELKAGDGGEKIHTARRQTDLEHRALSGEVIQGHAFDPAAKAKQCLAQTKGVLR